MKHLERRYGTGQLHFITCSCYRREPLLGTARARDCFLRILSEVRERYDFATLGYVVMPNTSPGPSIGRLASPGRLFEFATIIPATGQAVDCPSPQIPVKLSI